MPGSTRQLAGTSSPLPGSQNHPKGAPGGRSKGMAQSTSVDRCFTARAWCRRARRGAYLDLHGDEHRAQLLVQLLQHRQLLQAQAAEPVRQREWDAFRHHHPWGPATWYPALGRQPGGSAPPRAQARPRNAGVHAPPRQPTGGKKGKEGN